jgi:hypothetical protein
MTNWIYARSIMTLYTTTRYVSESLFIHIGCKFELDVRHFDRECFSSRGRPSSPDNIVQMTRIAPHIEFLVTFRDVQLMIPRPKVMVLC